MLGLKGKIINALTNPEEKVLANQEVQLLFSALGLQVDKRVPDSKLRYGEVGILTDEDSDGSHICLLLLALFARHMPQLLEDLRVYRYSTPLYVVKNGKKIDYYYTEEDFKKNYNGKGDMSFIKGLTLN